MRMDGGPRGLRYWRAQYVRLATARVVSRAGRNLTRLHGRFATVFAVGMLGRELGLWELGEREIFDAVMSCERDHVALIDAELAAMPAMDSSTAPRTVTSPIMALADYIRGNLENLVNPDNETGVDPLAAHPTCPGYALRRDGATFFLFSESMFQKIAGGPTSSKALKTQLDGMGLIEKTMAGGQTPRFSCRKPIGRINGKAVRAPVICVLEGLIVEEL